MDANQHQRVMQILSEAIEQEPDQRDQWLADVCVADESLHVQVARLLAHHSSASKFLEESPLVGAIRTDSESEPIIESRVGMYRILRELGRGGMGVVYLAERDDLEFAKRAAVKVIKRGMDTDLVLQRFRNERQILANLDHPNIARLLDGGTTTDGLPYFIMEYVEGEPIDQYADSHQMTILERLELFRTVCSAIQYAHQNLVVHRDIKPSNILVTNNGEPKLLDFGIAKLLQTDSEKEAELTATALRVMTPEFASPEQVKGERITTSSDVYSLGVLLYKLLTGLRPYRLNSRNPDELVQAIREQQPEKPSHSIADFTSRNAESRTNSQSAIRNPKSLRGDLDNIVLMALRKEPQRRYASVEQFSEDIRRYLEGLPVLAHQTTFSYRTSKFVRRHKLGIAAAGVILITIVSAFVATVWEARVARAAKARAERRFNDVRNLAMTYNFEFYDSIKDLPGSLAARQLVIKRALEYLDSLALEAGDDRELQGELALAYQNIGAITFDVEQLVNSRRRALTINESLSTGDPANDLYRSRLSDSYDVMSDAMKIAGNTAQSLEYAKKSLEVIEALPADYPNPKEYRELLVHRYLSLSSAQAESGDSTHAIESARKAVEVQTLIVNADQGDKETLRVLSVAYGRLSDALEQNAEYGNSLDYAVREMGIARTIFESDRANVRYRRDMWGSYFKDGRLRAETGDKSGALQSLNIALEYIEGLSAADPQDRGHRLWLSITLLTLGNILADSNKGNEALKSYLKAVAIIERLVAVDSRWLEARRYLTCTYTSVGRSLNQSGQTARAVDYLRKAIALAEESSNADPQNVPLRRLLAEAYSGMATVYSSGNTKKSPQRVESLRVAREWSQKSLTIYQDMKSKETLRGADADKEDEAAREIDKCDAFLVKLH